MNFSNLRIPTHLRKSRFAAIMYSCCDAEIAALSQEMLNDSNVQSLLAMAQCTVLSDKMKIQKTTQSCTVVDGVVSPSQIVTRQNPADFAQIS